MGRVSALGRDLNRLSASRYELFRASNSRPGRPDLTLLLRLALLLDLELLAPALRGSRARRRSRRSASPSRTRRPAEATESSHSTLKPASLEPRDATALRALAEARLDELVFPARERGLLVGRAGVVLFSAASVAEVGHAVVTGDLLLLHHARAFAEAALHQRPLVLDALEHALLVARADVVVGEVADVPVLGDRLIADVLAAALRAAVGAAAGHLLPLAVVAGERLLVVDADLLRLDLAAAARLRLARAERAGEQAPRRPRGGAPASSRRDPKRECPPCPASRALGQSRFHRRRGGSVGPAPRRSAGRCPRAGSRT